MADPSIPNPNQPNVAPASVSLADILNRLGTSYSQGFNQTDLLSPGATSYVDSTIWSPLYHAANTLYGGAAGLYSALQGGINMGAEAAGVPAVGRDINSAMNLLPALGMETMMLPRGAPAINNQLAPSTAAPNRLAGGDVVPLRVAANSNKPSYPGQWSSPLTDAESVPAPTNFLHGVYDGITNPAERNNLEDQLLNRPPLGFDDKDEYIPGSKPVHPGDDDAQRGVNAQLRTKFLTDLRGNADTLTDLHKQADALVATGKDEIFNDPTPVDASPIRVQANQILDGQKLTGDSSLTFGMNSILKQLSGNNVTVKDLYNAGKQAQNLSETLSGQDNSMPSMLADTLSKNIDQQLLAQSPKFQTHWLKMNDVASKIATQRTLQDQLAPEDIGTAANDFRNFYQVMQNVTDQRKGNDPAPEKSISNQDMTKMWALHSDLLRQYYLDVDR